MCIINIHTWDYCNHMRQISSAACFYVLSRPGMTVEECPNPQHNFIEKQPDWQCPVCLMNTIHGASEEAEDASNSQNSGLVAATEVLSITYDGSLDWQHAPTPATTLVSANSGSTSLTPVNIVGARTPDCPHGPCYCGICHPDEASDGSARFTAIVDTPSWVGRYSEHAVDESTEDLADGSVATNADVEERLRRELGRYISRT